VRVRVPAGRVAVAPASGRSLVAIRPAWLLLLVLGSSFSEDAAPTHDTRVLVRMRQQQPAASSQLLGIVLSTF